MMKAWGKRVQVCKGGEGGGGQLRGAAEVRGNDMSGDHGAEPDAVRRVPRPALLVITSAPVPTAMPISSTPSPSLQQYVNLNADLPT